jgi:3-oxoacyl-[acyl-carrier protein] reductase
LWDADQKILSTAVEDLQRRGEIHSCFVDVTDPEAIHRAADSTRQALGRLDILVTSAGITGPIAKGWDYPPRSLAQGNRCKPERALLLLPRGRSVHD